MKKMELTCVVCPNGCLLSVWEENGETVVEGAMCKNGIAYGKTELTDPRRVLTTSVAVNGGTYPLVSVRSTAPIPRNALKPAVNALKHISVNAPVKIGDLVYEDPSIGLTLLASRNVEKAK